MPLITLNLPNKENEIIDKKSKEWNLSKGDTILRIIREYKGKDTTF